MRSTASQPEAHFRLQSGGHRPTELRVAANRETLQVGEGKGAAPAGRQGACSTHGGSAGGSMPTMFEA